MPIRAGAIAEGGDFFDRVTELQDLSRYIEGNHILLTGPRRLGKSSLLKRFAEEAAARGILAKLVDVEGIDSAASFVTEIARAFPDASIRGYATNAGAAMGSWLSRIRRLDVKWPGGRPTKQIRRCLTIYAIESAGSPPFISICSSFVRSKA